MCAAAWHGPGIPTRGGLCLVGACGCMVTRAHVFAGTRDARHEHNDPLLDRLLWWSRSRNVRPTTLDACFLSFRVTRSSSHSWQIGCLPIGCPSHVSSRTPGPGCFDQDNLASGYALLPAWIVCSRLHMPADPSPANSRKCAGILRACRETYTRIPGNTVKRPTAFYARAGMCTQRVLLSSASRGDHH